MMKNEFIVIVNVVVCSWYGWKGEDFFIFLIFFKVFVFILILFDVILFNMSNFLSFFVLFIVV